jgi:hypothetical protein
MPIWFVVLVAICACFAVPAVVRSLKGDGIHVFGEKVSRLTIVLALIIIGIAWALAAATQLGFIPNHAP